jgi:hypothetical protein
MFWNCALLAVIFAGMGKGLSRLQTDILAALEDWPSLEQAKPGDLGAWALPRDIIAALSRPKTPATRAAISKALARLHARGAVARASGEIAIVGKSFRYLRITDPKNSGMGNAGPLLTAARRKMKTVAGRAKSPPRG